MKHFFLGLLCAAILVSIAACGGGSSIPGIQNPGNIDNQGNSTLVSSDGFELSIHDSSFLYGGAAQFSLEVTDTDGGKTVSIITEASDLRSVHLRLDYDAASLHPVDAELETWPGNADEQQISLAVTDRPGSVHLGSTIVHPHVVSGVSGEFSLASIRFAPGAFAGSHMASSVPTGEESRIPDLQVDKASGSVSFSFVNNGDYDQNSMVGIADITPLGVNFGESAPAGASFPFDSALSVVDGDGNGAITLADITPIAVHFGNSIDAWNLYAGNAEDYPAGAESSNGAAELLGSIAQASGVGLNKSQFREVYETALPVISTASGDSFWLRPSSTGNEGISSNLAGSGAPDNTAPFWVGGAPEHAGVMSLVPGDGSMRVNWHEADDSQSWPGIYTVYWNEGEQLDFESASSMEVNALAKDDEDAGSEQTAVIEGLSNDMLYAFAVRVRDGAEPANWEDNGVVLSAMPLASRELPSEISGEMELDGPWTVADGNTVEMSDGASLVINGDLVIDGILHAGDADFKLIVKGDLIVNGQIVQELPDEPAVPSDDAKSVSIVAEGNAEFNEEPFDVNGNLQIVSSEEDLLSPEEATEDIDNGDFEEFPYTFMPLPEEKAGSSVSRSASKHIVYYGPRWTWHMQGDWKTVPVQPKHVKRVVLRVFQRNGRIMGTNWNITGPSGRDGNKVVSCDTAVGEDGEDNRWSMRMHASSRITLNNCTITMGNGGRGGDADALNCCPTAMAQGGKGGKSNNKFRITAGRQIRILNNFTMNPGWGGDGGNAKARGADGKAGCPATDGCAAVANGGDGGDMPLWGMRVRGNVFGAASITLGKAFGGDGGEATANGGRGGDDTCCEVGGAGGSATATGGSGGMAKYITGGGFTGGGGGAESGSGGHAKAYGGDGGNGNSCFKKQAGDGGDGGDATAFGGFAGTAAGEATTGDDGNAEAIGGDGGDGGDGWPVGVGGLGGFAIAVGAEETEEDGLDGEDGDEWPVGGLWIWCIDIPTFLPDPSSFPGPGMPPVKLSGGTSGSVNLLDSQTMQVIGSVPFTVHDNTGDPTSGVYLSTNIDNPDQPRPQIDIINNGEHSAEVGIDIELVQLELVSSVPVAVTGASFDISQSGYIVPGGEIPGYVNFYEPDPFIPLGGMAFPEVPYMPGMSTQFDVVPDPSLPDGSPSFNMGIFVVPSAYCGFFTIYIIDP